MPHDDRPAKADKHVSQIEELLDAGIARRPPSAEAEAIKADLRRRWQKQIAEARARRAALAAVPVSDWIIRADAVKRALPVLFEDRFLGFANGHDTLVLEDGPAHPDWARVYQLSQERDAQATWTLKWLNKRELVEHNGMVRLSRLDQDLAEFGKHKPTALVMQAQAALAMRSASGSADGVEAAAKQEDAAPTAGADTRQKYIDRVAEFKEKGRLPPIQTTKDGIIGDREWAVANRVSRDDIKKLRDELLPTRSLGRRPNSAGNSAGKIIRQPN